MVSGIAVSERDWEAEDDANTLARAAEIQADEKRLQRAAKAAKKMVDEASVRAAALGRIAKKAPKSRSKAKKAGGVKMSEW